MEDAAESTLLFLAFLPLSYLVLVVGFLIGLLLVFFVAEGIQVRTDKFHLAFLFRPRLRLFLRLLPIGLELVPEQVQVKVSLPLEHP